MAILGTQYGKGCLANPATNIGNCITLARWSTETNGISCTVNLKDIFELITYKYLAYVLSILGLVMEIRIGISKVAVVGIFPYRRKMYWYQVRANIPFIRIGQVVVSWSIIHYTSVSPPSVKCYAKKWQPKMYISFLLPIYTVEYHQTHTQHARTHTHAHTPTRTHTHTHTSLQYRYSIHHNMSYKIYSTPYSALFFLLFYSYDCSNASETNDVSPEPWQSHNYSLDSE